MPANPTPEPPEGAAPPADEQGARAGGTADGPPVGQPSGAAPAEAVTPLIRGIAVLRELTDANGTLSLSALERATGLARSTVDRITATLARMGYVRVDGRDVFLAPRLMELGNAYLAALRLPALLSPHADALADELDESVSLAVADRDGIRFIHQATRRRAMSLSFRIGDLLPAERTAPGPLFATEWTAAHWQRWRERRAADPRDLSYTAVPPRTRGPAPADDEDFVRRTEEASANGWALDDQLIEPGLVAISVPVRAGDGKVACVASVVSHTSRHTARGLRETLLPRLRSAVTRMEEELHRTPPPEPGPRPADLALWTGASKLQLGRDFVESLARGLTVLTAFGEGRPRLTLTEVAQATGLARATARRALITYEHLGLVTTADRTFTLTPRVLSLGFPPLSRTTLPQIAQPHLAALTSRIHESTALAVLSDAVLSDAGEEIQYTARVATGRVMSVNITVGTRLPAHATASGRVLLADAGTPVHTNGYALVDEELEEGLRSLAVPIRDRQGRVVAALSTAMHASRHSAHECVTALVPELTATATHIESDLHTASRFTHVPLT
ncbi:IclR family transcriptional regulator domain-containing protein [Streptomyces dubilierae]|uniref:IclR family transcriptional regulator C-terminal domain-containing protein n=1 Tax=Streptomyces dubilierae TaxID=3075533 RepID=A0ABU2P8K1_9ACTN|nr:IclR family transcriptional regulator C-terminal domain-containing protein [Streptomyces sp. DSM 41921]MDT0388479.1 IclR family transcriptional regulator C-terminal domain-containing protein [Streptomyces sp. DSM 41921]